MTTPHKATPEQWRHLENGAQLDRPYNSARCLLELRDRLTAAEQRIKALEGRPQAPAPAGGLVDQVAEALTADPFATNADDARAAILAVADWLEAQDGGLGAGCIAARWLREEVNHGPH